MSTTKHIDDPLTVTFGNEELVIRRRYEILGILNDFSIAIWFTIGSIFFLFPETGKIAAWLFVIGSLQFLARPTIRLIAHFHLRRIPESQWNQ
ncbi:MAG TPA: YrhK family protein [Gammaproteobacteria bacterium]|nr:YrhK family protein [Gammaproteobacteria bacterium]